MTLKHNKTNFLDNNIDILLKANKSVLSNTNKSILLKDHIESYEFIYLVRFKKNKNENGDNQIDDIENSDVVAMATNFWRATNLKIGFLKKFKCRCISVDRYNINEYHKFYQDWKYAEIDRLDDDRDHDSCDCASITYSPKRKSKQPSYYQRHGIKF